MVKPWQLSRGSFIISIARRITVAVLPAHTKELRVLSVKMS